MTPGFGRDRMSHRDLRRALHPVNIRAGLYRLKGHIRTVNRSDGLFYSGLVDTLEHLAIRYIGEGLHGLEVGRKVHFEGYVDVEKEWGAQYRVNRVISSVTPREVQGLSRYLESNVSGLGKVWAGRLIDAFGLEVLARLREDPGIVTQSWPQSAQARKIEFGVKTWIHSTNDELWAYSVAPHLMKSADITYGMAKRICEFFTSAEVADLIVRRDPYRLLDVPGLAWKRVDAIALSMGIGEMSILRHEGGVRAAVLELSRDGSTALLRSELIADAVGRIDGDPKLASRAIALAAMGGELLRFRGTLVSPTRYDLAWRIADTLLKWSAPIALGLGEKEKMEQLLSDRPLTDEQKSGVRGGLTNSVFLLTGGPGTGKTYTLSTVIEVATGLGVPVTIVAPTGKAASRASEVTGHEGQTIHKALGGPPGGDAKNGPISPGLLIVEESSMLDQEVAAWLLKNCNIHGSRILFVGDDKQLPPVGPGAVFRDLIRSGQFPFQVLTKVHRQARGSPIIRAAHAIRKGGNLPAVGDPRYDILDLSLDAVVARSHLMSHLGVLIEEERRSESRWLTTGGRRFDPREDLQVLTTRNSGPFGAALLNQRLQRLLNPGAAEGPPISGGASVRVGDRLICTANDYSIGEGVFNGQQGRVVGVGGDRMRVEMEDGRTVITAGPVQNGIWALAYAITVHKSQGSEYPIVVLLLHSSQFPVLGRDMLYTGLTRAKRRVLLAGDRRGIGLAENHTNERRTVLADILREG